MTRQAARAAGNDTAARGAGNYSTLALSFARRVRASNLSPAADRACGCAPPNSTSVPFSPKV